MRSHVTVGSADSWFWAFGLLIFAPMILSEPGLLQSIVIWLTETSPTFTVTPSSPAGESSSIGPAIIGSIPGTNSKLYLLLAALFLASGRCKPLISFAPSLVGLGGVLIAGWILYRDGSWVYPTAVVPVVVLSLVLHRRRNDPGAFEYLRALTVVFGMWLLFARLPYAGIAIIAIGAFGMAKPERSGRAASLILAVAAVVASTLIDGTSATSVGRYTLYGVAIVGVIIQFGRSGKLSSLGALLALLIFVTVSMIDWRPDVYESVAASLGWVNSIEHDVDPINWIELSAAIGLLAVARWFGVISEQNSELIDTLRKDQQAPSYFKGALVASAPMLGLAAVLWVGWFVVNTQVERRLIEAYVADANNLNGACPEAISYKYDPSPDDYLAVIRMEIERDRLEMRRCFAYKVDAGVKSSRRSVSEVADIAKSSFKDLWPDRLPGTVLDNCGTFDLVCWLKNGIKSIVNRRYQKLKKAAISRFNASTDEEANRLNAISGSTGESMKIAVLSKVDDQAKDRHGLAIEVRRKSTLIEIAITAYLLLQALKLYLSVLARFVLASHKTFVPINEGRGPVLFSVIPDGKHGRRVDVDGWQFSSHVSIANCKMRVRKPYQPGFAVIRRLRRWYITRSAEPLKSAADPPCLIEPTPDVFIKVRLKSSDSAITFDPADLIGFKEGVKFSGEWNFRLIALVFCQHRRWVVHGPGAVLLRLPNGATNRESASGVDTVRVLGARHQYGVAGSHAWWDVALTPETIEFPVKSRAWIAPKKKWRARLRILRSFLLPV